MEFFLKQDAYNKKVRDLVEELPLRVQSIIDHFPDMIAELVYQDVLRSAPGDIQKYPKMLKLRRFSVPGVDSTVGIVIPGYDYYQRLKTLDVRDTVLYIVPKEYQNRKTDPGAIILSKRNPWTMTTLPYEPGKPEASIRSRKVSAKEVKKVEAQRKQDLSQVKAELKNAGIKVSRVHPVLIQRSVARDLVFEVLRREFGIEAKHQAHWRPAIRAARRRYVTTVMRKLVRWLSVPSERRWKTEVMTQKGKASTVKGIQRFQDYIAANGR